MFKPSGFLRKVIFMESIEFKHSIDISSAGKNCALRMGDIDGDGAINGKDSYYLACVLAGSIALEEGTAAYFAADIDGDGDINGKDAFSLKCIVSGSLIV